MSDKSNRPDRRVEKPLDTTTVDQSEKEVAEVDELTSVKEELSKEKDKFLRLFAEFENYKKRTSRERIELFKTASEDVLKSLLPVMDDFDRGYKEIEKSSDKDLIKGFELIQQKFRDALKSNGLQEVEVTAGDDFNADDHEAITQIPAPDKSLIGKIVDVVEKGYKLGDKTIRFPKVVTGK